MKRFWDKVDKSGDCWEWTASKRFGGYGEFRYKGKKIQAHRAALIIGGVDIPSGMVVMHSCDNPGCVNPDHLSIGTQADNIRDMCLKGRNSGWRGGDVNTVVLTKEDVVFIRQLGGQGRKIAKCFGVSETTISNIINRKTWKWV